MELHSVKTAVVGCGMISHVYIRNLMHLFHIIDLVAVCDIREDAALQQQTRYGVPRVMTLDEIAESDEIELVVNLTAPSAHYEVIRRMLLADKHVFTEKMLTCELSQGQELVRLADEKGLYLGVAPDTVLGAGIQTARWAIDHGLIGRVTSFSASINRDQCLNSEIYRFLRNEGGAFPYDIGIYYVCALLMLLGPVSEVTCFTAPAPIHNAQLFFQGETGDSWQIPGSNLVVGGMRMANGALGSIHFSGNTIAAEQHCLTIYGDKGILKLGDPNRFDSEVRLCRMNGDECVLPPTHGYGGETILPDATPFEQEYGHRGLGVAEMAWALRTGRAPRCSKEYGLHAMEVLCGFDLSAASTQTYHLQSTFTMTPLPDGFYSSAHGGSLRLDAERSLAI